MKKKELKKRIEDLETRVEELEYTLKKTIKIYKDYLENCNKYLKKANDFRKIYPFPDVHYNPDALKVTCCEAEAVKDYEEAQEYLYTGIKPDGKETNK